MMTDSPDAPLEIEVFGQRISAVLPVGLHEDVPYSPITSALPVSDIPDVYIRQLPDGTVVRRDVMTQQLIASMTHENRLVHVVADIGDEYPALIALVRLHVTG